MSSDNPIVAEVVRNGFVESVHHGRVVVLGADGAQLIRAGDIDAPILPRSCLKPMQALAMLRAGWSPASPSYVALASASHSGEPEHVDVVRRMLADAGLDEQALQNTPDQPLDDAARIERIRNGDGPSRLTQNCSGKHAAMLLTCVARDWPLDTYLDRHHPLQEFTRATLEDLSGEAVDATVVDGCGAPAFALSLLGLARAFAAVAATEVGHAMRAHPQLVGGNGRDVTRLMQAAPGLAAKDGAEGVFVAAGTGAGCVAVKVDDGAARARTPAVVKALALIGFANAALSEVAAVPVLGHGEVVGHVRATSAIG